MSRRIKEIVMWIFFPTTACTNQDALIMANKKLHDAVDALKLSVGLKTTQIGDLTTQLATLAAASIAKDAQIAALTAEVAADGTATGPLQAQISDLTTKLTAANTQIDTLTKAASDNDADDNSLADSIATA